METDFNVFFKKFILLFSKDASNLSEATVETFIILQKFFISNKGCFLSNLSFGEKIKTEINFHKNNKHH